MRSYKLHGAILTISQIIKAVMSSAAEAKIGALYINCKEAIPAQHTLEFLGHKQPPTPMQTDNSMALGVVSVYSSLVISRKGAMQILK